MINTRPVKVAVHDPKSTYKKKEQDPLLKRKLLAAKHPAKKFNPIVVIITSYNNEKVCEKNLESVFSQNYDNYRVIYIDDCSTDQTYERVANYIALKGQQDRVTLIRNPKKSIKMANLYKACLSCRDEEIIATLDGDDWLIHEKVLATINQYYQSPDVWMTHGSAIIHPEYREICGTPIEDAVVMSNTVREHPFKMSMLRTFYAGLFKQIHLKDLLFQDDFIPTADDVAFMYPMAEMAGVHCVFVPEILYVINDSNPIREMRTAARLQEVLPLHIKSREKYLPLSNTFNPARPPSKTLKRPAVYLISHDEPRYLESSLLSILNNLTYYSGITVLCKVSKDEQLAHYQEMVLNYPSVRFVFEDHAKVLADEPSDYIVLASDKMALRKPVELNYYLREMEQTGASSFFIGHQEAPFHTISLNKKTSAVTTSTLLKFPELSQEIFFVLMPKRNIERLLAVEDFDHHIMETYLNFVLDDEDVSLIEDEKRCICLAN